MYASLPSHGVRGPGQRDRALLGSREENEKPAEGLCRSAHRN